MNKCFDLYSILGIIKQFNLGLHKVGDKKENLIYFSNTDNNDSYFAYSTKEKMLYIYSDAYKTITSKISANDFDLAWIVLNAREELNRPQIVECEPVNDVVDPPTEDDIEDDNFKREFGDLMIIDDKKEKEE